MWSISASALVLAPEHNAVIGMEDCEMADVVMDVSTPADTPVPAASSVTAGLLGPATGSPRPPPSVLHS